MDQVEIFGVNVDCLEFRGILSRVLGWSKESNKRNVMYVNAHSLNLAYSDPEFQKIINRADLLYPDGISVVWGSRLFGGPRLQKLTAADWFFDFCNFAVDHALRIFILAGRPGVADQAKQKLLQRYPQLNIVGISDGYFQGMNEIEIQNKIAETQPHILFVGMGTPIQEKWILKNRKSLDVPVCWSVGALFDFIAGFEKRTPEWMNKMGLEWFWRLIQDPFGKWKRYLVGNPLFVYRVLKYKFSS